MKIFVDNKQLFELADWQLAILADGILGDLQADIERRLKWVIDQKLDTQLAEMKASWLPVLQADDSVAALPKQDEDLVRLIIARADYKTANERV